MKSTFLYLVLLLSLALVSCEKNKDEEATVDYLLIGKWEFVSFKLDGEVETHEHSTCGKDYFEFTKDLKFAEYYYNEENNCSLDIEIEGSYSKVDEKTLMLSNDEGEKISATIKNLTKDKLILLIDGEEITHQKL